MARSASVLTAQEAKLLSEIAKTGKITSITSDIGKAVALRRMEKKGLVEKIPVPTYKVSQLGQQAVALQQALETFGKSGKLPRVQENMDDGRSLTGDGSGSVLPETSV